MWSVKIASLFWENYILYKRFVSILKTKNPNSNSIGKLSWYIFSDYLDEKAAEMGGSHVKQLFISRFSDLSMDFFSGLFD